MAKFVLIDPSIMNLGGHYYEYAARVLEAAEQAGYTPRLATNRQFADEDRLPWPVHRVYRYSFFLQGKRPSGWQRLKRLRDTAQRAFFSLKARSIYSRVGLLWLGRRDVLQNIANWRLREWCLAGPLLMLLMIGEAVRLFRGTARRLRGLVGRLVDLLPGGSYLRRGKRKVQTLVQGAWRQRLPLAARLVQMMRRRTQSRAFGADTEQLFREVGLEAGDAVFIPTLNDAELRGLLHYFQENPRSRHATWHLLFRRDIYKGYDPEYPGQDRGVQPLRNTFQQFRQRLAGQQVFFYTDTDELSAQYNRLGVFDFRTLPVPVGSEYQVVQPQPRAEGRLQITYLGDARTEKGYHYLPRLAQDLASGYLKTGRVTMRLQSNFNIPWGEPRPAVARALLQHFPPEQVELLLQPLERQQYRDLACLSDLLLIPYDPYNYSARSSGVFAEAMTAGVPVVVPGGTWMALQMEPAIAAYHQQVLQAAEVLTPASARRPAWELADGRAASTEGQGRLAVQRQQTARCTLDVPGGATHVLVSLRHSGPFAGPPLCVTLEQRDGAEHPIQRRAMIACGQPSGSSTLFAVEPRAVRAGISLAAAYTPARWALDAVAIEFLRTQREVPLSAVGMTYADPESLTACVREIIEHLGHYRDTARRFAQGWSRVYNPQVLVERIGARASSAAESGGAAAAEGRLQAIGKAA